MSAAKTIPCQPFPSLPKWAGADHVYTELGKILEEVNRAEYVRQVRDFAKTRKKKATFRYNPPEEVRVVTDAMGRGDEEALKHALSFYKTEGYFPSV